MHPENPPSSVHSTTRHSLPTAGQTARKRGTATQTDICLTHLFTSALAWLPTKRLSPSAEGRPPVTQKFAFCKLVCGMWGLPGDKRPLSVHCNQAWNAEEKLISGALHRRSHDLPGCFDTDGEICRSPRGSGPPCQAGFSITAHPSLSVPDSCPSCPPIN